MSRFQDAIDFHVMSHMTGELCIQLLWYVVLESTVHVLYWSYILVMGYPSNNIISSGNIIQLIIYGKTRYCTALLPNTKFTLRLCVYGRDTGT